MGKYNFFVRAFIVAPLILVMGVVWALIALFSIKGLGTVLKQTGENFLND